MKLLSASRVLLKCLVHKDALVVLSLAGIALFLSAMPASVFGDTAEEIQLKISEQQEKIAELEKEIALYETQLVQVGNEKKTLESEVKQLDISRKKIGADIAVTEGKIKETNLEIENLGGEIGDKETRIARNIGAIEKSFRSVYQTEDITIVEHLFTASGLVEAWEEVDRQRILQRSLQSQIDDLLETKAELTEDLNETQKKQNELKSYQRQLSGQKQVLDQNRKEQNDLLTATKNTESAYQKLLTEKQQAKLDFEKQITDYEAQLKFTLDPASIPVAGSGVLSFPLDRDFMARCADRKKTFGNIYCITQYFGDTEFARSGAYSGKGHNGVDFGASSGTKIVSALSGTVEATGNTDAYKGCYSYGKWVLVKHMNGLSTLYAHLSIISVSPGDPVATGGLIGYSGKTGYATGPHLHFTVLVSEAVKLVRYGDIKAKTNCANAQIPVAATEAYLNPMSYL